MSDFINTVDIVDDDVLMDGLIEKSISGSFNDNRITSIKNNAFYGCTNLESVSFPNVTKIRSEAFKGSGLKAITPDMFPLVTTIDDGDGGIFSGSALETVDWPSLSYVNATGMLNDCASLKSVNLPSYISDGYKYGGLTLNNCTSLTDVNLPVATQCPSFQGCTSLETITLPLVTTVTTHFNDCTTLQLIDLPSCTTAGGQLGFRNCPSLKALILRSTTMCVLNLFNNGQAGYLPFQNTGITNGTGYIYIPSALIDSYKTDTNWMPYASQFRPLEDYTVDGTITGEIKLHCDSISLDVTSLTFTDANSYTLTLTTQLGILDEITWTTSDKTVARVKNGVVTPVGDGTATITVTCGEHSATCAVIVNDGIEFATNILLVVDFNSGRLDSNTGVPKDNASNVYTDKFVISDYAGSSIDVKLTGVTSAPADSRICYYDANSNFISCIKGTAGSGCVAITSTVPANAEYAAISIAQTSGFNIEIICDDITIGTL